MQENKPKSAPRPFLETLRELRNGATLEELSEELATLIAAVRHTNKGGKLVLTISIKPATAGDAGTVLLTDSVSTTLPEADRRATLMFTTEQNGLSRKDPNQAELTLRDVGADQKPALKEVG